MVSYFIPLLSRRRVSDETRQTNNVVCCCAAAVHVQSPCSQNPLAAKERGNPQDKTSNSASNYCSTRLFISSTCITAAVYLKYSRASPMLPLCYPGILLISQRAGVGRREKSLSYLVTPDLRYEYYYGGPIVNRTNCC